MNRRQFISYVMGMVAGLSLVLPALAARRKKEEGSSAASENLPLVKPGEGMAATVSYVHVNTEIKDPKLRVERQGVKFEDQKCASCILYTKHGTLNGEEVGKCSIFPNQLVKATGWCTSWAKKG